MKTFITILLTALFLFSQSGCAHDQNGMVAQAGSIVGQCIGAPVGMLVVAVEETFDTASDIDRENPRYLMYENQEIKVAPCVKQEKVISPAQRNKVDVDVAIFWNQ